MKLKQFEIRITISAPSESKALEELQQIMSVPAPEGDRIWAFVKQRVDEIEIERVDDGILGIEEEEDESDR